MKILQTKITTIDDFSYSINVINKLFTLEQELVLATYESEYERMQKSMRKKRINCYDNYAYRNRTSLYLKNKLFYSKLTAKSETIVEIAKTGTSLATTSEEKANKGKNN